MLKNILKTKYKICIKKCKQKQKQNVLNSSA
jgi:hypothetical protein